MDTKPEQSDIYQQYAKRLEKALKLSQISCQKTTVPYFTQSQLAYVEISWAGNKEDEKKFTDVFSRPDKQRNIYTVSLPQHSLEEILNKLELEPHYEKINNIMSNMSISPIKFFKKNNILEIHLENQSDVDALTKQSLIFKHAKMNFNGKNIFVVKMDMETLFKTFTRSPEALPTSKDASREKPDPMSQPSAMHTPPAANPIPATNILQEKRQEEPLFEKKNPLEIDKIIEKASSTFVDGTVYAKAFKTKHDLEFLCNYLNSITWIPGSNLIAAVAPHMIKNALVQLNYLKKHNVSQIIGLGNYLANKYALSDINYADFVDYCLEKRTLLSEEDAQTKLIVSAADRLDISNTISAIEYANKGNRRPQNLLHHSRLNYMTNQSEFKLDFHFFRLEGLNHHRLSESQKQGFINLNEDTNDQMKSAIWTIYQKSLKEPVLVQCANGTGRTGHFILMLEILKNYEAIVNSKSIENAVQQIHGLLENIRGLQPMMVHNREQFEKAIHNASEIYQYALKKGFIKQETALETEKTALTQKMSETQNPQLLFNQKKNASALPTEENKLLAGEELFNKANEVRANMPVLFDLQNKGPGLLMQALELYKAAALEGHVESMYLYAHLFYVNIYAPFLYHIASDKSALREIAGFLIQAASLDHTKGQFDLLRYYLEGRPDYGIEKDLTQAAIMSTLVVPKLDSKQLQTVSKAIQFLKPEELKPVEMKQYARISEMLTRAEKTLSEQDFSKTENRQLAL